MFDPYLPKASATIYGMTRRLCYSGTITSILVLSISEPDVIPRQATNRIEKGITRGEPFAFTLDGQAIQAFPGETIAAALLAINIRTLRRTEKTDMPRGVFCGMGICFDCVVTVDGSPHLRACMTEAEPGMDVKTQDEAQWRAGRA
jgi:hypothetical protein